MKVTKFGNPFSNHEQKKKEKKEETFQRILLITTLLTSEWVFLCLQFHVIRLSLDSRTSIECYVTVYCPFARHCTRIWYCRDRSSSVRFHHENTAEDSKASVKEYHVEIQWNLSRMDTYTIVLKACTLTKCTLCTSEV